MAILVEIASIIAAQQMQDALSMSSDGWRPIVGTRRQPNHQESSKIINEAHEDAETTISSLTSQKYAAKNNHIKDRKTVKAVNKLHPKSPSGPSSSYYGPTGGSNQQLKKLQVAKKPGNGQNKSRKPIRGQMMVAHHSTRNEVFLPPPSNSGPGGSYSTFRQQQQNNVKIREAQGFGIISNNFGINQYPVTSDGIQLQRPSSSSSYYISKPLQNNDDFTRNFLPPARPRGTQQQQQQQQQKSKGNTKISLYAFKDALDTDVASGLSQFGPNRPSSITHHQHHQYLPQIVPTYDFTINQKKKTETTKVPSSSSSTSSTGVQADVQVTKENVKQYTHSVEPTAFGTIPPRNNYAGFADYSSFPKTRPTISPNSHSPLTYEVTEGKWIDTPSQHYQFRPQDGFYQYQNIRQNQNNVAHQRPGFLFQNGIISTNRPAILQSPLVDISVPFLPTPYKPDNVILPTSASENEASTVFTHVSNKMNRLQQYNSNNNNQRIPAQENNNIFFNIKEVSTHYPILGTPEPATEIITDTTPPLINENNTENEIIVTTHKEVIKERPRRPPPPTTHATTTIRDPTRARITNKRRPIKIITTTTTTSSTATTDEDALTEPYEPAKSQEIEQEKIVETERPHLRRRRPRPPFRMPQEQTAEEQVSNADEPIRTRTRGNFRPHTRVRTTTTENSEEINSVQRKKYRPTQYRESMQNVQDEQQFEDNKSEQSYYNSEEPIIRNYETTFVRQENRPYIEEIPVTTEKIEDIQKVAFTTEQDANTHQFHNNNIPENEIDYTKSSLETEDEEEEEITRRPTTSTQQPTTTSTTEATTTTRATRIRTRPNKDDLYTKRPRFSVKDKNRYTSTTTPSTTTTTQQTRSNSDNLRIRFPSRIRTRPSPTTAASSRIDENVADEITTTTLRTKFVPKDPRFGTTTTTTESNNIITQNPIKAGNTRIRSFTKPAAETTTYTPNNYPKISIRPNLFSARRRDYTGLKSRINKFKKNDTEIMDTTKSDDDAVEGVDPLNSNNIVTTESSSGNISSDNAVNESESEDISTEYTEQITENIMRDEDFFHSQRVSDLTSSFKDYDKPGVFNSISPTSRSIPNHFTISTDDPILPLEAFFPSLKETPIKEIR